MSKNQTSQALSEAAKSENEALLQMDQHTKSNILDLSAAWPSETER